MSRLDVKASMKPTDRAMISALNIENNIINDRYTSLFTSSGIPIFDNWYDKYAQNSPKHSKPQCSRAPDAMLLCD
jgi:hypothetical protein